MAVCPDAAAGEPRGWWQSSLKASAERARHSHKNSCCVWVQKSAWGEQKVATQRPRKRTEKDKQQHTLNNGFSFTAFHF